MSDFLIYEEYKNFQISLNESLAQSKNNGSAFLHLYKSILQDTLSLDHITSVEESYPCDLDSDINLHTQYHTKATSLDYERQNLLNSALKPNEIHDFRLLNALWAAPLSHRDNENEIPEEVIQNLPFQKFKEFSDDVSSSEEGVETRAPQEQASLLYDILTDLNNSPLNQTIN